MYDVGTVLHFLHDFELARHDVSHLHGPFKCYWLLGVSVKSFKNIAYPTEVRLKFCNLPKAPCPITLMILRFGIFLFGFTFVILS